MELGSGDTVAHLSSLKSPETNALPLNAVFMCYGKASELLYGSVLWLLCTSFKHLIMEALLGNDSVTHQGQIASLPCVLEVKGDKQGFSFQSQKSDLRTNRDER